METLQASDVMRRDIITVSPDTPLSEFARLLVEHDISAAPVIEHGQVAGVVSEGDLLHRPETGTEGRIAWWRSLLTDSTTLARHYIKTHGTRVRDVMTSPAITVSEDTPLLAIADILETHGIKQVPVVRNHHLIGLVSRADLVRALADHFLAAPRSCDDATIRSVLEDRLTSAPWAHRTLISPSVHDGVVEFEGWVKSPEERRAVQIAAETIPGVRAVHDHLLELNISPSTH